MLGADGVRCNQYQKGVDSYTRISKKYLIKYGCVGNHNISKCNVVGIVTANIESLFSKLRIDLVHIFEFKIFQEPYSNMGFCGHFVKCFRTAYTKAIIKIPTLLFFPTLRLHASDTSEIRKKIIDIRNPMVS